VVTGTASAVEEDVVARRYVPSYLLSDRAAYEKAYEKER
jgi:hypothetical protein